MGAVQFIEIVQIFAMAAGVAGAWLFAFECSHRAREANRCAREATERADRMRDRLCRVLPRAQAVYGLWEERDAALAELEVREEREHALEVEVENLRARAGEGVWAP